LSFDNERLPDLDPSLVARFLDLDPLVRMRTAIALGLIDGRESASFSEHEQGRVWLLRARTIGKLGLLSAAMDEISGKSAAAERDV